MRTINKISGELLDILEPWRIWFEDQEAVPTSKRGEDHNLESATSSEYLETMLAKGDKHKGIPEHAFVSDFVHTNDMPKKFIDKSLERFVDLYAAAGHPNCIFKISFSDLQKITNGLIKEISE